MKTEIKTIIAVVAALAALLGCVAITADDADATDNIPAIWPGEYEAEQLPSLTRYVLTGAVKDDTEHQFGIWKYSESTPGDLPFINAEWIYDEESGYTYWLDQTDGGNWFTILGATQVELDGKMVSYRIRYDAPVDAGESLDDSELQIKFYNDIIANPVVYPYYEGPYSADVVVTGIEFKKFDLENSDKIETEIGTVYVTGLQIRLVGNYSFGTADMLGFSKIINVPVVIQKLNISLFDAEFEYPYNGLWQTPVADYADNENATYYKKGVVVENPTPYAPEDSFDLADVQEKISVIVGEDVTLTLAEDSTVMAYKTNKYVASAAGKDAEPYIIKFTADSEKVNGEVTITWWIMPLGIDDLTFDIFDPYYNFDQEVRPKVVVTWTEPEDGPRPGYVHMVGADNLDITYTMPDNYPYDFPYDLVPSYEYEYDGYVIKMEPAKDEQGNPILIVKTDENGNPIYKLDDNGEMIPVLDDNGEPVMEQARDSDGNLLYEYGDETLVSIHDRYSDLSFIYNQLVVDGKLVYNDDGTPVYDLDNPVMITKMYGEDVTVAKLVPKMEPVYEYEMEPVLTPVYKLDANGNKIPMMEQDIDDYGRFVFKDFEKEQKLDWNGNPVFEQKLEGGKLVPDTTKPIKVVVYEDVNKLCRDMNGNPVEKQLLDEYGEPVFIDEDMPLMTPFVQAIDIYGYPVYKDGEPVFVQEQMPKYDETSEKVMVQHFEMKPRNFTATQVGVPLIDSDMDLGFRFDYGVRIVCNTGYYEFDTDDYRPAADDYGILYETYGHGDTQYADLSKPLLVPELVLVDEEYDIPYIKVTGKPYDPSKFVWNILPLPLEYEWMSLEPMMDEYGEQVVHEFPVDSHVEYFIDDYGNALVAYIYDSDGDPSGYVKYEGPGYVNYDGVLVEAAPVYMAVLTVPAGYQHPTWDAPESIGNIKIVNPAATLDKNYVIAGPYDTYAELESPECQYVVAADGLMGQFMAVTALPFSDFDDALEFTGLNHPWWNIWDDDKLELELSVDTVVSTGSVSVEDIKKGVHLFPSYYSDPLMTFGPESFVITVVDASGDLVIDHDVLIRNSLNTDKYRIFVNGNLMAGYFGYFEGEFQAIVLPAPADGFTYKADPDYKNGLQVTGYSGDATEIVIPGFIDGKKVTSIGQKAFYGNKNLTYVKIGDNVRKIHDKAFANCPKLKSVDFSDSVQVIGAYAFYNDKALERVAFGHGLKAVRANAFSVSFTSFDMNLDTIIDILLSPSSEAAVTEFLESSGYTIEQLLAMDDQTLFDVVIGLFTLPIDYVDDSGKTQYDASRLVGNAFLLGDKALEKHDFPPSAPLLGYRDAGSYLMTCSFGQVAIFPDESP